MKACVRLMAISVALFVSLAGPARAQFHVTLAVDHLTVLQGEPIRTHLTVTNDSLYPLVVGPAGSGSDSVELDFRVVHKENDPSERLSKKILANRLSLEPGDGVTLDVDVSEWYNLYPMGRYQVSVVWKLGGKTFESNQELIDVISGIELTSLTKEVPFSDGSSRKYSLRYWAREGAEHLFLRAESEDGLTRYGVFELGELVRVYEPTITADRFGDLIITHQMGMGQFRRSEFKSTGEGVRFVSWSDTDGSGASPRSK